MTLSNKSSRVSDKRKEAAGGDMVASGMFIIKSLIFATLFIATWFFISRLSHIESELDEIDRRLTHLNCRGCEDGFTSIMDTLDKIEKGIRSAEDLPND